jgi:hypothetical protein
MNENPKLFVGCGSLNPPVESDRGQRSWDAAQSGKQESKAHGRLNEGENMKSRLTGYADRKSGLYSTMESYPSKDYTIRVLPQTVSGRFKPIYKPLSSQSDMETRKIPMLEAIRRFSGRR